MIFAEVWSSTFANRVGFSCSSFRGIKVQSQRLEPFVEINVTSDEKGNFYLDQKELIESAVKAAKVSGAKVQKLPYPTTVGCNLLQHL